jgi:hypothetical protein
MSLTEFYSTHEFLIYEAIHILTLSFMPAWRQVRPASPRGPTLRRVGATYRVLLPTMPLMTPLSFWKVEVRRGDGSALPCKKGLIGKQHNIPTEEYDLQGEIDKVHSVITFV